jgi:hypothetical protein
MNARWRAAIEKGLGGPKTRVTGLLLIGIGAFTKLLFLRYAANFEMIFAVSLVAGSVLGRWWTVLVPLGTLAIVEPILWGGPYALYGMNIIVGLSFFMVTGYLFVGLLGRALKPHVLFRVGSIALLTAISIPMTVAYDLWTDIGEYYFIAAPMGLSFWNVLEAQFIFTLYHVLSSLIFVPLIGMGIFYLHTVLWPSTSETTARTPTGPATPADRR